MSPTTWFHTTLRVKEPLRSIAYYVDNYNCTLLRAIHNSAGKFSQYYLTTLPKGVAAPAPDSAEAEAFLTHYAGTTLRLHHDHGSETDDSFSVNNGNVEPNRGFGHIAFNTEDVYAVCTELEEKGVKFQKKPDEGRMKGLAFALDPDGYWVEIVRRTEGLGFDKYNLSQTMMRVKEPQRTLQFYTSLCGLTLVNERHFESGQFSLFFLATLPAGASHPDPTSAEAADFVKTLFNPVLELTHNHGTESKEDFSYHNGNTDPKGFVGIGFLVDDIAEITERCKAAGVAIQYNVDEGPTRGSLVVRDPDNYWVEFIPRGLKEATYLSA